jgi:putative nucleotidyltransferase with HDIG domain
MAEGSVHGKRLLIAGGGPGQAGMLVARLGAAGAAAIEAEDDPTTAAHRAMSSPPDAIIALHPAGDIVRRALDPMGLDVGPPIIDIAPSMIDDPGAPGGAVERVSNALELRALRDRVEELSSLVADDALQRSRELDAARAETLQRLLRAGEYRDDNTWEHTERVAQLAARMGQRIGLPRRQVELVRRAAPLHDIGKIAIPDQILLKPGKLTDDEFEVVKTHTVLGARVLAGGDSDLMITASQIVRSHHERWDGTGYPDARRGEEIPVVARLVQVADVFDILTHERPHKEAWSLEEAAAEIRRGAGTQFDPGVVRAFDEVGPEVWRAPAPMRDSGSSAGSIA